MNDETRRWIEAGKVLAEDPSAKVECPRCGNARLLVEDVRNVANPVELERYMRCPVCAAFNVLRLKRAG